nr:hypothetical protein [Bacilli bacterium]
MLMSELLSTLAVDNSGIKGSNRIGKLQNGKEKLLPSNELAHTVPASTHTSTAKSSTFLQTIHAQQEKVKAKPLSKKDGTTVTFTPTQASLSTVPNVIPSTLHAPNELATFTNSLHAEAIVPNVSSPSSGSKVTKQANVNFAKQGEQGQPVIASDILLAKTPLSPSKAAANTLGVKYEKVISGHPQSASAVPSNRTLVQTPSKVPVKGTPVQVTSSVSETSTPPVTSTRGQVTNAVQAKLRLMQATSAVQAKKTFVQTPSKVSVKGTSVHVTSSIPETSTPPVTSTRGQVTNAVQAKLRLTQVTSAVQPKSEPVPSYLLTSPMSLQAELRPFSVHGVKEASQPATQLPATQAIQASLQSSVVQQIVVTKLPTTKTSSLNALSNAHGRFALSALVNPPLLLSQAKGFRRVSNNTISRQNAQKITRVVQPHQQEALSSWLGFLPTSFRLRQARITPTLSSRQLAQGKAEVQPGLALQDTMQKANMPANRSFALSMTLSHHVAKKIVPSKSTATLPNSSSVTNTNAASGFWGNASTVGAQNSLQTSNYLLSSPMTMASAAMWAFGEGNPLLLLALQKARQTRQITTTRVEMTLHPANLGKLHLQVQAHPSGQLQIQFLASQTSSKSLLEKYLPDLKQSLQQSGFTQISVDVRSGGGQSQQYPSNHTASPLSIGSISPTMHASRPIASIDQFEGNSSNTVGFIARA